MGGAQPLAVAMLDGVCLIADVDPHHLVRRVETRYLDLVAPDLDTALREVEEAKSAGEGRSIGLVDDRERAASRAARPRRRARHRHRPDGRARPARRLRAGRPLAASRRPSCASPIRRRYIERARAAMARQVRDDGRVAGARRDRRRLRQQPAHRGQDGRATRGPSTTPASCPPTCGRCSAAASGRSAGRRCPATPTTSPPPTPRCASCFPTTSSCSAGSTARRQRIAFQGLPARICWIGYGDRHRAGLRFNELVRSGEVTAPLVIGRDHLDSGSVASPYRETEAMRDGSDAIADWPLLNAMLNVGSGAAWVALHHGGGVGIGRSIHSGAQVVADGTDDGALRRRARADERPRHRRHAPRPRGLRRGARPRAGDRARPAGDHDVTVTLVPDVVLDATGVHRDLAVLVDPGRRHDRGPDRRRARSGRRRVG